MSFLEQHVQARKASKEIHQDIEDPKLVYSQIIATLSDRAKELHDEDGAMVEQFKQMSRRYGADDLSAENYCKYIGKTFGTRIIMGSTVPEMAKLIPDTSKREALKKAHGDLVETIRKDREAKKLRREKEMAEAVAQEKHKQEALEAQKKIEMEKVKAAAMHVKKLKVKDIVPVQGEEAQQLHKNILGSVQIEFNNDAAKLKEFSSNARRFGNQQMNARDFFKYLIDSFDADFVARLVPDLARLLHDADKRHALLNALCESAPGWARFAGL